MGFLDSKVAVVTGGSRGIGAAIARRFVQEGAAVVLAANEAAVHGTAESLRAGGGRVASIVADVTQPGDVARIYD
ncbi:MAG TPA: SDR family NAD(P)-dependent oxidoreductase, partial [Acidisoma sp.]|nr:SDR family NAD(P)-dependent oxidoreductase [Acidisoma sp.]